MKLGANAKFLGSALTLLPSAQIEAGLDETPSKFDCAESQVDGWWYFGVTIKRTKNAKTMRGKLQKFVTPEKGSPIGWYGYGQERGKSAFFAFWFYCAGSKARKRVKERLLQNGVKVECIIPDDDEHTFIEVRAPLNVISTQRLSGDRSWFGGILKAAMKHSASH